MRRWLLKLWHRFTLGRTAIQDYGSHYAPKGSRDWLLAVFHETALENTPGTVGVLITRRNATDVPKNWVRIVLEYNE